MQCAGGSLFPDIGRLRELARPGPVVWTCPL